MITPKRAAIVVAKGVDKDGNPLPGATVRIKDTQMGVVSDQDGKFKLEVGEIKDLMLQVSFIGYKTQTVKPG